MINGDVVYYVMLEMGGIDQEKPHRAKLRCSVDIIDHTLLLKKLYPVMVQVFKYCLLTL